MRRRKREKSLAAVEDFAATCASGEGERARRAIIIAPCIALASAACVVGPDYEPPALSTPAAYAAPITLAAADDGLWWRGFEDPALDALIGRALADNVEIAIALARLAEAETLVERERSDLYPTLDVGLSGQASAALEGEAGSDSRASADAFFGFTPDLFGGRRRELEQARAIARGQAYVVEDARRLTAAAVADWYVELRRTTSRLELLKASLDLQRQTLAIVEQRFAAGLAADLDVRRAESDLSRTAAQRGTLRLARARAEHALSVLLGQPPGGDPAVVVGAGAIPTFRAGPPVGAPAELVRRRPDLRVAEADLAAAIAGIGVERADLYPSLRLPGVITADLGVGDGVADEVVGVLSASLDIPLLDAGRRRAEVRGAEAAASAALLAYRQTLLVSLSEVENALVAIEAAEDRRTQLAQAVRASEQAFDQLNALYREGLATFIDILDAQRTLIANREAYVDSEAALATAIIALYAAVGAPTSEHVMEAHASGGVGGL